MSRLLDPVACASDESVLDVLPRLRAALSGAGPVLLPHAADAVPAAALRPGEPLVGAEDDPSDPTVAVVATSGSTGDPKGVLLHASALLASVSATHDRLGGAGRWLLALPVQHVAGLQVLVRGLVGGGPPVVLDLTRGFRPTAFAEAADRLQGPRRYTSLVPTQLVRLLDAGGPGLAALTGFDAVLVGGAATAPALQARARDAGVRLVTTYGMSETCGGCVYDGVPLDGVRVRLAPEGRAEEAGAERAGAERAGADGAGADGTGAASDGTGRVLLAGPVLARGYRGRAADDGSAAGGFVAADGARWFATDDAGRLHDDGRLAVLGRLDDVLTTGGLKVAPGAVEAALLRLPGVAEAVVVGVPDAEWGQRVVAAVVLAAGAAAPSMAQVREQVSTAVAAHATPRQLLVLDRMPLRGPGKPDRTALARLATLGDRG